MKVIHFIYACMGALGILNASTASAQTWGTQQNLAGWWQDPATPGNGIHPTLNNNPFFNSAVVSAMPTVMSGGSGATYKALASTNESFTYHQLQGVDGCSPAAAQTNNEYFTATVAIQPGIRTLRVSELVFSNFQGDGVLLTNYQLSLAARDVTANGPLVFGITGYDVVYQNNTSTMHDLTSATAGWSFITLIPGHSYEFRLYINKPPSDCGGNTFKRIDNPTINVQMVDPAVISGTVFNDYDGSTNGINNLSGAQVSGLNAILVDASGKVVAVAPVSATNGTYSFPGIDPLSSASFKVMLSTSSPTAGQSAPAAATLPSPWLSTGENIGTGTGNDGAANGISATFTPTGNVTDVDFGIRQPPVTVSGTLYNDNNGQTGGPDGTTMPAGITVTLYASNGTTVIATTTTDASGNYSFPGIIPGNYIVGITPPAGFQNVSSTDATPADGKTAVAVGSVNITGVNFGLNQPPVATNDNLANQSPGSPATVPNILGNDTDPNSGTLSADSISLVAPSGATGITTDAQGDVTGFIVPGQGTWTLNSTTGAVTFTPQSGFTGDPTPINYTVTDKAGLTSNPATITIDYNPPITISGTLYNDNNGQTGGPDGNTMPAGITVTLYASNGTTVIATTTTNASGNYSFPGIISGNYIVGITPPAGFQNVSSTDATPADGKTAVTAGSTNITGVNFGLNQVPQANTSTAGTVPLPSGTTSVPVAPAGFGGTDPNSGIIDSMRITGFPTNTTSITIGDITYYTNAGSIPPGCATCAAFPATGIAIPTNTAGQPTVAVSVDPSGNIATTVVIPYTVIDNANLKDLTPGSLSLPFSMPLPLEWLYFTATATGKDVVLDWATAMERNTDYFEAEYATDGSHFHDLGQVAAAGNATTTTTYSLEHNNAASLGNIIQYRIRRVDRDGQYTYSEVRSVKLNASGQPVITVYPNPVTAGSSLIVTGDKMSDVQVLDGTGRKLWSGKFAGDNTVTVPIGQWPAGMYLVRINGGQVIRFIIK